MRVFFNSRTAIAWAIIGLLLVILISSSRFLLRPGNVTTTSNLLFVHSLMQFQLKCVCDVIFVFLVDRVFLIRVIKFLFPHDLPHSQK